MQLSTKFKRTMNQARFLPENDSVPRKLRVWKRAKMNGPLKKWRYVFTFLGSTGMAIIYGLEVNLYITIVAMVNQTGILKAQEEVLGNNVSVTGEVCQHEQVIPELANLEQEGSLLWDQLQQGLVLGSYYWGYFVTQVPGGYIGEKYSAKWVFLGAIVLNIFGTLLGPVMAYAGFYYFVLIRILMGLAAGVTFPAMNVLIAEWAPQQERSTISSIIFGGTSLGTAIAVPTSGVIAGALGWEAVFYIHGGLSAIWCFLWVLCITDDAVSHPFMSKEEKKFIQENNARANTKNKGSPIPWRELATSVPLWALLIADTLDEWGFSILLEELPTFLASGLGFSFFENSMITFIAFLCHWIFALFYGKVLDALAERQLISTAAARKISVGISSLIPAICFIGVCLSGCDKTAAVACMIMAAVAFGSMYAGVYSNHVDIASNYAGVLMGITHMVASISSFLVPTFVGAMTQHNSGLSAWHTVFYVTSGILFIEFAVFAMFGSSVEQPWNTPKEKRGTRIPEAVLH